ncbi:hypothetical protein C0J52_16858 [Blattella germanica]|nr:hypothetical protein C0J52_16858 [Blattella germanica]
MRSTCPFQHRVCQMERPHCSTLRPILGCSHILASVLYHLTTLRAPRLQFRP